MPDQRLAHAVRRAHRSRVVTATTRLLLVAALVATLAACGETLPAPTPATASGKWWPPREYTVDPALQGRADAEAAIAAGRPLRLLHGESDDLRIDADTGLPVSGFGCCFEEPNAKYLDAYNAVIDAARAAGRLREFDFRPKQLPPDVARSRLDTAGRAFAAGDAPIVAPSGTHRVGFQPGDAPSDGTLFVERADGTGHYALRNVSGPVRVAFAEDGTTLLVSGGGIAGIETFDLPHAVAVQVIAAGK